jgi:hypothetical protein
LNELRKAKEDPNMPRCPDRVQRRVERKWLYYGLVLFYRFACYTV